MKLISRLEEIILLSIWRLQDNAYGIAILEEVEKATGKTWLTGSIYSCLSRMLKHSLVVSFEGEPAPERGGRRKIFYRLTSEGKQALQSVNQMHALIWSNIPAFDGKEEC
jgi:PadR family transcriptional regulator PadR